MQQTPDLFLPPTHSLHTQASYLLTHGDDAGWLHSLDHIVSGGSCWCCGGADQEQCKHWSCNPGTCERKCVAGSGCGVEDDDWFVQMIICVLLCDCVIVWYVCVVLIDVYMCMNSYVWFPINPTHSFHTQIGIYGFRLYFVFVVCMNIVVWQWT